MSLILDGTNGLSDVDGTAGTPAIRGSDANTGVFFGTDIVGVSTGGSERVRVDASGNVGIGTSSPATKLHVNGKVTAIGIATAANTALSLDLNAGTAFNTGGAAIALRGSTTGYNDSGMEFYTGNNERARIDSSGNLLVGTTSNPDTNRVVIKGGDGNQLFLDNAGTTYTQLTFANNGTRKVRQFFDNSLTRFYIDCNGSGGVYLSSGATSWTAASDERVKDIIEPIENATQKLSAWRTVVGKYKADAEGTRRSFLIAQDVLATFPEAVDTTNADEYGLNYQDLIPVLVKAIQELKAINDAQAQTIESLTARVVALEGQA